jgi:nicotinate phosphoribosyltransferase
MDLYRESLALHTDLYELTMAQGYWKSGAAEKEAVFHLFFRRNPFGGGFAIACGLAPALDWLRRLRFTEDDLAYLAAVKGDDGQPLLDPQFLAFLAGFEPVVDIDAMPEGTAVFAGEPLLRVKGPIIGAQILETAFLNIVNFQTLIATKAARVCLAARGDPVMEFGLRRAQGIDGGISASRAAFAGGCSSTSNVLAGKLLGIPVKGTHAHSWVMSFGDEREAFHAWADALPSNSIFLADTYDTIEGVRRAIEAGKRLEAKGFRLAGVRLDSGDLAGLSIEARRLLDGAGFAGARIVASGDLDEAEIARLKAAGARIDIWGVGTRLVTGHPQGALGGVYKLSAVRKPGGPWEHKLKLSSDPAKSTSPGIQQVRRFLRDGRPVRDVIHDVEKGIEEAAGETSWEDVLVPAVRGGKIVYSDPPLEAVRARAIAEVARLPEGVKRLADPEPYPVTLEPRLDALRARLITEARSGRVDAGQPTSRSPGSPSRPGG